MRFLNYKSTDRAYKFSTVSSISVLVLFIGYIFVFLKIVSVFIRVLVYLIQACSENGVGSPRFALKNWSFYLINKVASAMLNFLLVSPETRARYS